MIETLCSEKNESKSIKKLEEVLIDENPWLKHYFDHVRFPDGKKGRYNRIVERNGIGVLILPLDSKKRLGLIKIYRYPVGSWQWEAPRGYSEDELSPEEDAVRELKEEMGVQAEGLIFLGSIFPNTGILSTKIHVFLARNVREVKKSGEFENGAIKEISFFNPKEIKSMIKGGDIQDALTISGLKLAEISGLVYDVK